jgi:hypothetical protein
VNAKDRRVQIKHRKKKAKLRARRKEQAAQGATRPPARHA